MHTFDTITYVDTLMIVRIVNCMILFEGAFTVSFTKGTVPAVKSVHKSRRYTYTYDKHYGLKKVGIC